MVSWCASRTSAQFYRTVIQFIAVALAICSAGALPRLAAFGAYTTAGSDIDWP